MILRMTKIILCPNIFVIKILKGEISVMENGKIICRKMNPKDVFMIVGEICKYFDIELVEISIERNDVVIAFIMK